MYQHATADIHHLQRLATRLFTDGQFLDADQVLAELAEISDQERPQIALRRAQIGMLGDRMEDVASQLDIARDQFGRHVYFAGMEADMAIRNGDLAAAAATLRLLGRHSRADQLEGFADDWYQVIAGPGDAVTWDTTHALPLFDVTVNGENGHFVLDTGTGDCLLDSDFAQRVGLPPGPLDHASFPGGRSGHWQLSRIESLAIGEARFAQLPAMVASLNPVFRHGFDDTAVDGIIGAGLLRAIGGIDIDYRHKRFQLGTPGVDDGQPLWIAGPHYPLTPCRVDHGPASCWFIDSGMSGIDLACSASAARRYRALAFNEGAEAHGGGGALAAELVGIRRFQHADLEYPLLPAAVLPDFNLGRELGLRIGGLIGHQWLARHRVQLDYRTMSTRIWRE